MKKLFVFAAMAMMALTAFAQKDNSSFFEFQTDIPTIKGAKPSIGFKGGFLTGIDTNVRLGAGIGLTEDTQFNYAPNMPVFGRLEFRFNGTNVRPFVDVDLGYSVNFEDFENGQVFINPMIGADFNKYYIGVGYLGSTAFSENSAWGNNIALRLGMRFGGSFTPFVNFFKKITYGVEGSYAHSLGKSEVQPNDGFYIDNLNILLASIHFMYNIDEHWAAGIGAGLGSVSKVSHSKHYDDYTHSDSDIELFLRGEYTFNEVKKDIKPYATIDLGMAYLGKFVAPQVGVKYKDHIRLGLSLPYREAGFDEGEGNDATCLQINIGYDF